MTLTETSVIKRSTPEAVTREAARTRRARELGSASGLFRVPEVLACDAEAGILELERLHFLEPVQRLLAYAPAASPVWSRLGGVLAAVHGDAGLGDAPQRDSRDTLPPQWRPAGAADVAIHGDFDAGNIFYQRQDDMIVVLDWAVTPMLGVFCDLGPRCFDVAFFISGAFFLPRRHLWHRGINAKLNCFLRAYERESGETLDRDTLVDFARRAGALRVQRQPKSALQRASYRRSLGRLTRFLDHGLDYG